MNDKQSAFVERIGTSATHEIMNGLASVGQSTGLMQDLLGMGLGGGLRARLRRIFSSKTQASKDPEQRLQKSLLTVGHSMERTMRTTRALSRFLHSLTPSQEQISTIQALEIVTELMQPSAKQKKSTLRLLESETKDPFPAHPLPAYQAVVACIEVFLDKASQDELSLGCQGNALGGIVVTVQSSKLAPAEEDVPEVREICPDLAELGYAIERTPNGLAIHLPSSS